ncbi:cell surface receptor IPT/TIG domain-containing protein [Kitasatospora acidiphila]|uniref:Cell surface receptor IPT/TIG domain-containing protein n=1 Tax=Kitasatospora acidiphila TaxID=2567942 RepID=A0A540WHN3_9ACTN|nr:IPT/TIG domain-containing protein [Kitasatospora acidiphila]TQF07954.1 cell surface receptor IPT/TIG domain-containing protein [Kitasatospora acidiphila]
MDEHNSSLIFSISPASGPVGSTVTLTGVGFLGVTAVYFGAVAAPTFDVVSLTEITATVPAGSGTVEVTVEGLLGPSLNGVAFTYTPVAPVLAVVSPASGPVGSTVTLTGSGFSGATAVHFGAAASSFTVVSATQITATVPAGSGTVLVTVTTPGGTSNGVAFTYTPVAPVLAVVSPASGPAGSTVTLTGSGFSGATAVHFGAAASSFTVVSATQITATVPAGSGTVLVTVTTPGGTSNGVAFTYVAVPVLTSIVPLAGPSSGGTAVTLSGTGLSGTTAVSFGGTPAAFTVVSDTSVVATAPAGSGTVPVTVTTPGGTSNSLAYTYATPPVVASIAPDQGPASGGNTVTVTGSGFSGATAVHFGTAAASSFTVVSATQITATVPAGSPGPAQVTVTAPGGTSSPVLYYYLSAPQLSAVVPDEGPVAGGTTVTITGSNLLEATAVHFGAAASSFTVVSATQITATVPAGSGTVLVTVTTPGGTSNGVAFTYVAVPVLTSIVPLAGPSSGGTAVTLSGTGLSGTTAVSFGGTPAAFTVVSDTSVVATAPAGSGTVPVTVTTPGGTSNSLAYTYIAPPAI